MAEPKKALETPPAQAQISITLTGSSWAPYPVNSSVQPTGTVLFVPNATGWVWTMVSGTLSPVFEGQTNNYVQIVPGQTQQNTFSPEVPNGTTVTIIPLGPNSNPPEENTTDSVRGTIKVSSTGVEGKSEKE